ncbi:hypothetical protein BGZ76_008387 [Entomortierella beljakovae]|nr:hypothetical protein BGZ76_008387 [Entomortierella beljakovae]
MHFSNAILLVAIATMAIISSTVAAPAPQGVDSGADTSAVPAAPATPADNQWQGCTDSAKTIYTNCVGAMDYKEVTKCQDAFNLAYDACNKLHPTSNS